MQPRIVHGKKRKGIGKSLSMSLSNNRTSELWSAFVPRIKEIQNRVGVNFISLQVYPADYFAAFRPALAFQKWALVEVSDYDTCPKGMKKFTLNAGLFAVFDYKGLSADPSIFQYIYTQWLPTSGYELDDRPHFEVLGTSYKNNSPDSEEEIWIPIKKP